MDFNYYDPHRQAPPPDPLVEIPRLLTSLDIALVPQPFETIILLAPDRWSIGPMMIAEKLKHGMETPPGVVCTWVDQEEKYCIRKGKTPRPKNEVGEYLPLKRDSGRGYLVWQLSPNVFCKVDLWVEGITTEAANIRFVNTHFPSVPTEELIYDWVDAEWNRCTHITKTGPGVFYDHAWPNLNMKQRLSVADQVAEHCTTLATMTSDYIQSVQGTGLSGAYCIRKREPASYWDPVVEPRVSREDFFKFQTRKYGDLNFTKSKEPFVLQIGGLGPDAFRVTVPSDTDEMPKVTSIMNWFDLGYFPKYRVATLPREWPRYALNVGASLSESNEWKWMLSNACVKAGFPLELKDAKKRDKLSNWYFHTIPPGEELCCERLPPGYTLGE
ncbi:hypothetical protein BJ875DRAFT_545968 [Amylocarpus encephaloides]|uniref:Uncharacterized protein n=1 Tax=Amylocarpus encephaloides TaxID=45428 RepID=A0A9P8C1Q7_9HELO|nr:hypothetical protein BJ875DRAFT_545968 [Amylocarpus encephaloides]